MMLLMKPGTWMMRNCGAEYMEFIEDLGKVFAKALDKGPSLERTLPQTSTVILPADTRQEVNAWFG